MKKVRGVALTVFFAISPWVACISSAEECYYASGKVTEDAQRVRLAALDMGWIVGKPTSLIAATVIAGKAKIYPINVVEVCVREAGGELQIKAQSKSEDAYRAEWHKMIAKKKGKSELVTLHLPAN